MQNFDTIVLGLGGVGSAALYQLAKRGKKVLGIDQFDPPHTLGSSHGGTRITRQAIGEGVQYTPIVLRSYEIFREMEKETGADLLRITGGLMISSPGSGGIHGAEDFYGNCVSAATTYGVRHDLLDAADMRKRFPQFNVDDAERGYFEYESGVLFPERCVEAQLALSAKYGADIHKNERVISFVEHNGGVKVCTESGEYYAEQIVLSAGPWLPLLLAANKAGSGEPALARLAGIFTVTRQVQYWFDVSGCYESFAPGKFPIFIWEHAGDKSIYGFPALDGAGGGFKIGCATYNTTVTADSINRDVSDEERRIVYEQQIVPFFKPAVGPSIKEKVCLYTCTPDSAFAIDRLPGQPNVLVCSPCSGHGYKHTAAIGEIVAQMVTENRSDLDISAFKLDRLLIKA